MERDKFIKLTNAVYKVLEYLPESDPLKNRAKEKALAVMDNPNLKDIDSLLNYLEIAKSQGWINGLSLLIIQNEYEKIKRNLKPCVADSRGAEKTEPVSCQGWTERQKKILSFLEQNGKGQVSDLMSVLTNVTKRTIRRDIDELLKSGKVSRMGEFNQVFYTVNR